MAQREGALDVFRGFEKLSNMDVLAIGLIFLVKTTSHMYDLANSTVAGTRPQSLSHFALHSAMCIMLLTGPLCLSLLFTIFSFLS